MESIFALLNGTLVTGIDDDPEESATRVYIEARYLQRYVLVSPEEGERLRREWGNSRHLFIRLPDDAEIFQGTTKEGASL